VKGFLTGSFITISNLVMFDGTDFKLNMDKEVKIANKYAQDHEFRSREMAKAYKQILIAFTWCPLKGMVYGALWPLTTSKILFDSVFNPDTFYRHYYPLSKYFNKKDPYELYRNNRVDM
jgi:hypothetical protein